MEIACEQYVNKITKYLTELRRDGEVLDCCFEHLSTELACC